MLYDGLTFASEGDGSSGLGGNVVEGDPFTYSPSVWRYVTERFSIASVLDLGSGMGYSAAWFHRQGLRVVAVDGLAANVENAVFPTVQMDLTRNAVRCQVDLVHCQEVVEHVEELHLDNVLASLANGRVVLMTHALPGQGGYHHVNLQPSDYWIHHLARFGCALLAEDTARIRKLAAQDGACYLAQSGMIFANQARLK